MVSMGSGDRKVTGSFVVFRFAAVDRCSVLMRRCLPLLGGVIQPSWVSDFKASRKVSRPTRNLRLSCISPGNISPKTPVAIHSLSVTAVSITRLVRLGKCCTSNDCYSDPNPHNMFLITSSAMTCQAIRFEKLNPTQPCLDRQRGSSSTTSLPRIAFYCIGGIELL